METFASVSKPDLLEHIHPAPGRLTVVVLGSTTIVRTCLLAIGAAREQALVVNAIGSCFVEAMDLILVEINILLIKFPEYISILES